MSNRRSRRGGKKGSSRQVAGLGEICLRVVVAVVVLLVVHVLWQMGYLSLDGLPGPTAQRIPPGAANAPAGAPGDAIQTFFTTPWLVYPDVPEQRTPPPHEQALLADIDAAQTSVDAALYEYKLPSLAAALVRAQQRGVAVRLALDEENLEDPDEAFWAGQVQDAGIPIAWEQRTAFQHSKFFIIDGRIVWTGSWNASENGTYRNNNNLLRLTIPEVTANYAAEFEQMAAGVFGNNKEERTPHPRIVFDGLVLENYFSPHEPVEPHIIARLQAARQSIDFLAFAFTSDPIADAMLERHAAGVAVRGVFERRSAGGTGAEFDRLAEAGIDVLRDGNCYTMHHKVIIIDEETVITGSYNFTRRAEDTNDENLLIIDDPATAARFVEEFERVYGQARNPPGCGG